MTISNFMAILLQHRRSSSIAAGRDIAQACRDHFSPPIALMLWVLCEIAIAACDLAEVIGSAIALNLYFGRPLVAGVLLTAGVILWWCCCQHRGFRYIEELMVGGLVFLIGGCFVPELLAAQPALAAVAGARAPSPQIVTNLARCAMSRSASWAPPSSPHNLYLHSGIVQTPARSAHRAWQALRDLKSRHNRLGAVALLAFFINAAIWWLLRPHFMALRMPMSRHQRRL
ncbi:MAG: divalent metal cation transporter [Kouleothrix sp.]